ALWDRLLSPVTTVIGGLALVAVGMHAGAHEALLTALSPLVITDPLYIMRNGVLTVLCALAAYQCWSLHRKRTGR
ncbi:hypothetical protein E2P66_22925, partial [Xanthomonas perforans]